MKKLALLAFLVICFAAVTGTLYVRQGLRELFPAARAPVTVEVPHGMGARDLLGLLETQKVISNRYVALAYVALRGYRHKLQAGEYLFDRPMTIPEVVGKIAAGN